MDYNSYKYYQRYIYTVCFTILIYTTLLRRKTEQPEVLPLYIRLLTTIVLLIVDIDIKHRIMLYQ
mgnify:CR=1 FL=1